MKIQIATAVLSGVLSLMPGGAALAASIPGSPMPPSVSKLNSRDLMIQGVSGTSTIQLHFTGAERLEPATVGGLFVMRRGSRMRYQPYAYQIINGKTRPVTVSYTIDGADRVTVNFGNFDGSAPIFMKGGAATAIYAF